MMAARGGASIQEWFSAGELARLGLPGLPTTTRGVLDVAAREGWAQGLCEVRGPLARPRRGRGGGTEYHVSLLPEAARTRLAAPAAATPERLDRDSMWIRWERLPDGFKARARTRLEIVERIEALERGGLRRARAVDEVVRQVLREARAGGVEPEVSSCGTIYAWLKRIDGVAAHDRAAYLAPDYAGRTVTAQLPHDAFELYKADYLRQSRPTHAACYRNLQRMAADRGWNLPSAKTLQRRLDAEVPMPVQTLCRKGQEAVAHAFPHLERDRSSITPMQIGNLDGHTWDVRVQWPDGTISRPHSLAVQDIASGKVLAIRHDMTLNHHLVRLALGDTFREFGLFETLVMDNGRENNALAIAGGQIRNRWARTPEEEPAGLLKLLNVKAVFATPYWGQAKPVERAFRDFAHGIAKTAAFEGAYTGHNPVSKPENYGERAIPLAEFDAIVRREIAFHNARLGRRGAGMNGRSFDQVFAEGVARRPARRVTPEQLRLCLLSSRPVSMDQKDHSVRVEGHRYWSPDLGAIKPQKVIVRFDPEAYDRPAYVYSLDGRLLAEAQRIAAGSFDRHSDAQAQRARVRDHKRAVRQLAEATKRLQAADVEAAIAAVSPAPSIPTDDRVVALDFKAPRTPDQLGSASRPNTDFEADWAEGLTRSLGRG
jgi:hypothetical protein